MLQPAGLPGTISIGEPLDEEELDQYESAFHVDFDDTGNDSLEKFDYIFHDWIREHGGTIAFNTCARVLTQDEDGTVTGLIATNENGEYVYYKANKAVIMCAGSYGATRRWWTPSAIPRWPSSSRSIAGTTQRRPRQPGHD